MRSETTASRLNLDIPGTLRAALEGLEAWSAERWRMLTDVSLGEVFPDPLTATVFLDLREVSGTKMVIIPAQRFLVISFDQEQGRVRSELPLHEVTIAGTIAHAPYAMAFDD